MSRYSRSLGLINSVSALLPVLRVLVILSLVIILSATQFGSNEPYVAVGALGVGALGLSLFTAVIIYHFIDISIRLRDFVKQYWKKHTPHRTPQSTKSRYDNLTIDIYDAKSRLCRFLAIGLCMYAIGILISIFLLITQPKLVEKLVQDHSLRVIEILVSVVVFVPNSVVEWLLPNSLPANSAFVVVALLLVVVIPSFPFALYFANLFGIYTRRLTDVYLSLYWMLSGESSVSESQTREVKLNLVYDGITILLLFLLIFVEPGF